MIHKIKIGIQVEKLKVLFQLSHWDHAFELFINPFGKVSNNNCAISVFYS